MQRLFDTRSIGLADGLVIVLAGVALLALLEIEKLVRRAALAWDWRRWRLRGR